MLLPKKKKKKKKINTSSKIITFKSQREQSIDQAAKWV
jgi:hypothetical protein